MSGWEQAGWWAATVLGLIGTALLSGLETGVYVMSRLRLELRAARGPRAWSARLLKRELDRPERLLATNLVANIICGDLAATGASQLLAARGYSDTTVILVNVAILTPVFFVFVESVPKELFRMEADRLTTPFAGFLTALRVLLTAVGALPLVRLIAHVAGRLLGGEGETDLAQSARERIATMLKDTTAAGGLSESQAGMVDRALVFQGMTVADEMVPWSRVRMIPADWTRDQAMRLLMRELFPYWPVVERRAGGTVRVLGVVRHQDLFLHPGAPLASLAQAPARLPARMGLQDAVRRLREAAVPVGIVEDGGRPIGMVTMTDLVEPLTGAG